MRRRAVPTWGVFPDKSKQGGGPLIDIGTHALDITLWCMDNYSPKTVTGSVFEKLGHLPEATEGNMFGPWDTKTYEVEDSAFGYVKECKQWLEAIIEDKEPLVKPEQAFVVTQILDTIYKAAAEGHEIAL